MLATRPRLFHSSAPVAAFNAVLRPRRPHRNIVLDVDPDSAMIKVAAPLKSPVEAFALIRDVERRYGTVREFTVKKDAEVASCYTSTVLLAFKDPASYELIPVDSATVSFKRPPIAHNHSGGVRLSELEPWLKPQQRQPSESSVIPGYSGGQETTQDKEDQISYNIKRNDLNFCRSTTKRAVVPSNVIANSFLQWGGFHDLKPIPSETSIEVEHVFRPSTVDNIRMRYALRQYSEQLKIPNPYETYPGTERKKAPPEWDPLSAHETAPKDSHKPDDALASSKELSLGTEQQEIPSEWDPLPGYETAPKDTPMPSDILASSKNPTPAVLSPSITSTSLSPPATTLRDLTTVKTQDPTSQTTKLSSLSTQPSERVPESVASAAAVAAQMKTQAKSMLRKKVKQQKQRLEKEENPLGSVHPAKPLQSSMRDLRNQQIQARQREDVRRDAAKPQPKTVTERISSFFSSML